MFDEVLLKLADQRDRKGQRKYLFQIKKLKVILYLTQFKTAKVFTRLAPAWSVIGYNNLFRIDFNFW